MTIVMLIQVSACNFLRTNLCQGIKARGMKYFLFRNVFNTLGQRQNGRRFPDDTPALIHMIWHRIHYFNHGHQSWQWQKLEKYLWARRFADVYRLFIRTWWRHQMEIFPALLAICAGNSPVTGEFPAQRPVMWRFDVFFDLRLNKRLSKRAE